ncbi:MAG: hypothetical protein SGARI_006380 [Bacillariaceae sp.]
MKDDQDNAMAVLTAADRFGITGLKLYVESEIAAKMLKGSNAVSLLFFADAHSCALLKEAAFDMYVKDAKAVMKSDDWTKVKESPDMMEQLLAYTSVTSKAPATDEDGDIVISNLSVSALRKLLEEIEMEIDGTRETLIKRLLDGEAEDEE